MTEVLLVVVVLGLLGHGLWRERGWDRERRGLLNRLEAKNAFELVALNRSEQAAPKPKPKPENGLRPDEAPVGL